MAALFCRECQAPMALADTTCPQCGAPADPAARGRAMMERAVAQGAAGDPRMAMAALERAAGLAPASDLARAWLAMGQTFEREAAPARVEAAADCYERALGADDALDQAHQLWIANLCRRGLGAKALARYQARLQADPADAAAARYRTVAKLAADFQANPPKVEMAAPAKPKHILGRLVENLLTPTNGKLALAGFSFFSQLAVGIVALFRTPELPPEALAGPAASLANSLFGPSTMILLSVPFGVWFAVLVVRRRRQS